MAQGKGLGGICQGDDVTDLSQQLHRSQLSISPLNLALVVNDLTLYTCTSSHTSCCTQEEVGRPTMATP